MAVGEAGGEGRAAIAATDNKNPIHRNAKATTATTTLPNQIDPKQLQFEQKVGEGEFGVVYRASYLGTPVAVKVLKDNNAVALGDFRTELNVLQKREGADWFNPPPGWFRGWELVQESGLAASLSALCISVCLASLPHSPSPKAPTNHIPISTSSPTHTKNL